MKTLIIAIIDESGSMGSKKSDVIGGFNGFIDSQKEIKEDEATFYMIKFNTVTNIVHNGLNIVDVPHLTGSTYLPGGNTALYDAIAEGIRIGDKAKKPEERVVCVIMTDGEENSSKETTKEQVKTLISGHEAKGDWTFMYIGENPDRWAQETGMKFSHVRAYDHVNALRSYDLASKGVSKFRKQSKKQTTDADKVFDD